MVCDVAKLLIHTHHEQGAGHTVEGYAQGTGMPGVVLVTPNVHALAKPCTKWFTVVNVTKELPSSLQKAFEHSMHGRRGPVLVAIPNDISSAVLSRTAYAQALESYTSKTQDISDINATEDTVSEQTKQMIRWSGQLISFVIGPALVSKLSEKAHMPVATTLLGLGSFDEDKSELVHMMGARLDARVLGDPAKFAPKTRATEQDNCGRISQFDLEPGNVRVVKSLVGNDDPTPHQIVIELDRQLRQPPMKAIISTGVGQHQMGTARSFHWRTPRAFLTSGSMGTIGFGLPAAIGAQLGCPDSLVIDLDGDGSFNMTMEELLTASQRKVPVKTHYTGRPACVRPQNADFVLLAESMGSLGCRCGSVQGPEDGIQWLLEAAELAVLDVELGSEPHMLPIVRVGLLWIPL
ncbi:thiamine diphosphate-binding protein [Aspergillus navahoensis]